MVQTVFARVENSKGKAEKAENAGFQQGFQKAKKTFPRIVKTRDCAVKG